MALLGWGCWGEKASDQRSLDLQVFGCGAHTKAPETGAVLETLKTGANHMILSDFSNKKPLLREQKGFL